MQAIIVTGGKQYKVAEGDTLFIEKLEAEAGQEIVFDQVLAILDDKVPEIFEEEVKLDYEERLDRSAWDKRYFTKLTYWFQENFAKSRVGYIKEVGMAVHQDTAQKYNESINRRPSQPASKPAGSQQGGRTANPTQAPAAKGKQFPVLGVLAAVAALVLVVVLIVKFLSK